MHRNIDTKEIVSSVSTWLDEAVIGLQLCPFAKVPRQRKQIHFVVSNAQTDEDLLTALAGECLHLVDHTSIETSLLVIPGYLQQFDDFNEFLSLADDLLTQMNWFGIFQIASFHPHYQFANTRYDDRENWTNRAPYPILHILRESSLSRVIDTYPGIDEIPSRNIDRLNRLDSEAIDAIFSGASRKLEF